MANTYIPIQTVTASSGSIAAIEFTTIPGTYKDLLIKASLHGTNNDQQFAMQMRFNDSSATSQYYTEGMQGYGRGTGDWSTTGQSGLSYLYTGNPVANPSSSTVFANVEIYISQYSNASWYKTYVEEVHSAGDTNNFVFQQLICGSWLNTSPITKISMYNEYGQFGQYSTATIYGIG